MSDISGYIVLFKVLENSENLLWPSICFYISVFLNSPYYSTINDWYFTYLFFLLSGDFTIKKALGMAIYRCVTIWYSVPISIKTSSWWLIHAAHRHFCTITIWYSVDVILMFASYCTISNRYTVLYQIVTAILIYKQLLFTLSIGLWTHIHWVFELIFHLFFYR